MLFHARDRFLRPGGHLIPGAATMEVMPVTAAALHEREIASWSRPQHGVDLGAARSYAANTLFYRTEGFEALTELADPVLVNSIDFHTEPVRAAQQHGRKHRHAFGDLSRLARVVLGEARRHLVLNVAARAAVALVAGVPAARSAAGPRRGRAGGVPAHARAIRRLALDDQSKGRGVSGIRRWPRRR